MACHPILEATIPGSVVPDEFVLVHAHLDSWHEGIGDNATGDALLLELARVFKEVESELARGRSRSSGGVGTVTAGMQGQPGTSMRTRSTLSSGVSPKSTATLRDAGGRRPTRT